ncbi:conserved hypothetical protein [Ricinus communis]|uniref:Uncharacterized protein n=1 Tax=Ricinus communis TaxID=3988 RepID=B9TCP5_RICCO|nr:conserved hypothetical protein [Ricinus communis]
MAQNTCGRTQRTRIETNHIGVCKIIVSGVNGVSGVCVKPYNLMLSNERSITCSEWCHNYDGS